MPVSVAPELSTVVISNHEWSSKMTDDAPSHEPPVGPPTCGQVSFGFQSFSVPVIVAGVLYGHSCHAPDVIRYGRPPPNAIHRFDVESVGSTCTRISNSQLAGGIL